MTTLAGEVVWVAITNGQRRVFHTREGCFRQNSPRIPSLRVYLERAGFRECHYCRTEGL